MWSRARSWLNSCLCHLLNWNTHTHMGTHTHTYSHTSIHTRHTHSPPVPDPPKRRFTEQVISLSAHSLFVSVPLIHPCGRDPGHQCWPELGDLGSSTNPMSRGFINHKSQTCHAMYPTYCEGITDPRAYIKIWYNLNFVSHIDCVSALLLLSSIFDGYINHINHWGNQHIQCGYHGYQYFVLFSGEWDT